MAKHTVASNYAAIEALRVEIASKDEVIETLQKQVKSLFAQLDSRSSRPQPTTHTSKSTNGVKCGNCSTGQKAVHHDSTSAVKACYQQRYATQA